MLKMLPTIGNSTRMKEVNDFLNRFNEIFNLYKTGGLSQDTYQIVIEDLLNHLDD